MKLTLILSTAFAFSLAATSAPAATLQFNLTGTAGSGLRFGNETGVLTGGSGDEFGTGITFDDVSKFLSINVNWGSANGYTSLTGVSTNAHLHSVTDPFGNDGTGNFKETGPVVVNIQADPANFTTNTSASAGSITGGRVLSPAEETLLLTNKFYLNVHTGANPGGEMRGFLVPVPEPAGAVFGMAALGAFALRRRRA